MAEKRCFDCGEVKPLDDFYGHPHMADGHLNKCKECTKRQIRARELDDPGRVLATRLSLCERNPTKYNAHRAVEFALLAGVIERPDHCLGCGRPDSECRVEAHHSDYSRPLEVVWVCTRCHRQLDANRREREGKSRFGRDRGVILVYDGRDICAFDSVSEAARAVGRKPSSISNCLGGTSKTCAGYGWKYKEE